MVITIPRTGRQSVAGNFPGKSDTHLHLARVRKWKWILSKAENSQGTNPMKQKSKVWPYNDWANDPLLQSRNCLSFVAITWIPIHRRQSTNIVFSTKDNLKLESHQMIFQCFKIQQKMEKFTISHRSTFLYLIVLNDNWQGIELWCSEKHKSMKRAVLGWVTKLQIASLLLRCGANGKMGLVLD